MVWKKYGWIIISQTKLEEKTNNGWPTYPTLRYPPYNHHNLGWLLGGLVKKGAIFLLRRLRRLASRKTSWNCLQRFVWNSYWIEILKLKWSCYLDHVNTTQFYGIIRVPVSQPVEWQLKKRCFSWSHSFSQTQQPRICLVAQVTPYVVSEVCAVMLVQSPLLMADRIRCKSPTWSVKQAKGRWN